jgi:hypothetical protein
MVAHRPGAQPGKEELQPLEFKPQPTERRIRALCPARGRRRSPPGHAAQLLQKGVAGRRSRRASGISAPQRVQAP